MMAGLLSLPVWVRVVASVLIGIGVFVAGTVLWATRSQEAAAIAQARVSASTITQVTVAGMKAVMLTGDAAQQTGFVEHLRRSQGIEALRIVPAESVRRQFGAKTAGDARADAVEAGVLGDAQPYTAVERLDGKLTYRAVVPVLVQGRACLGCHQVDEGAVLGAVSLRIGLDEVDRSSRTFRHGVLLAALAGSLPVVLVSYLLVSRTVSRPLLEVVRQLREIAEGGGDLTKRLPVRGRDEVGQLASSFNTFVDTLHGMLRHVRDAAMQVASAAGQLSASTGHFSSGTQQHAASLEETAASLTQLTATVKQTADSLTQANRLAMDSRVTAQNGGAVVTQAVTSMTEITTASKRISEIIATIDEIAFQTNLLALNAAVEAARAGEQGRGFAVVAVEVRNLAQRSAAAAKEIKALIQDSGRKVEAGAERVNRSGQTLQDIVASVQRVTGLVAEITSANREQAQGLEQVSIAVNQMGGVVQANVGETEELLATGQALAEQAERLRDLIGGFKLEDATSPPAVVEPAARPAPQSPRIAAGVAPMPSARRSAPPPALTRSGRAA